MWNLLKEKFFPPPETKWLVHLMVPSFFLVVSALVLIVEKSFFQSGLLALTLLIELVYAISGKKSFFITGLLLFAAASAYCYWMEGNIVWTLTLFISLYLAYEITGEVQTIFLQKESLQKELERDVDLWKNRFETIREKIDGDKVIWETEMDKLTAAIEEKKSEIESLRVLISISHKETRRAEKKMEGLNQALGSQQEALKARQLINESLQTKKSAKQPISLKDLRC